MALVFILFTYMPQAFFFFFILVFTNSKSILIEMKKGEIFSNLQEDPYHNLPEKVI